MFDENKEITEFEYLTTVNEKYQIGMLTNVFRENNIVYMIKHKGAGEYLKIVTGFSIYGVEVYVKNEDIEKAIEVLEELGL